ncbi:hypothetical protein PC110_g7816 [Phytophthora cactorum]|uniref:Uncharacterized protein n=1 Tax=Phytophthora cactorum TaxID=29920 RepID=A0A329SJY8_9STRA|nr:hypothetical protein PC110_g7816 [Phytophthora cactorum]
MAALRVIAHSSSFDSIDENLEIAGPTVSDCIDHFCDGIIAVFGDEFLRPPRREELERLLELNERRGFPGMAVNRLYALGMEELSNGSSWTT